VELTWMDGHLVGTTEAMFPLGRCIFDLGRLSRGEWLRWSDATYPIRLRYGDPCCFDGYQTQVR